LAPDKKPAGGIAHLMAPDGVMTLAFAGSWTMDARLPAPEATLREIDRPPRPARIVLATGEMERWDSALLAFIRRLQAGCRLRGVTLDLGDLPPGISRLLELAGPIETASAAAAGAAPGLAERIGAWVLAAGAGALGGATLLGELAIGSARWLRAAAQVRRSDVWLMVQRCGADALPIVAIIAVLVGMILAFIGNLQLSKFGANIYVADLVTIAVLREMGAIMTGIVLAGRTGAAYAAEIAAMQGNEEIDALATLGISPIEFLVMPRVFALAVMTPILVLYADAAGLLGGVIVTSSTLKITAEAYLVESRHAATAANLLIGLAKGVVFGLLIGFTGCRRGLAAARNAAAVGNAATSAVVSSILQIIIADACFAVALSIVGV
jgi:phospholipid/cholesterol/gamma-HCH transport system permease protein